VVIINLGDGFFLESEKMHKDDYDSDNKRHNWKPQSFSKAPDSTINYKNYKEVSYKDRHGESKEELLSMIDLSVRVTNNSQNFILLLEVANYPSEQYYLKKMGNPDY
jgi:hypothetical protein